MDYGAADHALLAQIASGDRAALEALYRRHSEWITARLQHRCADADLVDTAVQDTFLAAWRGAARYSGRGDVGAGGGIAIAMTINCAHGATRSHRMVNTSITNAVSFEKIFGIRVLVSVAPPRSSRAPCKAVCRTAIAG